jgi:hypothetical protein
MAKKIKQDDCVERQTIELYICFCSCLQIMLSAIGALVYSLASHASPIVDGLNLICPVTNP